MSRYDCVFTGAALHEMSERVSGTPFRFLPRRNVGKMAGRPEEGGAGLGELNVGREPLWYASPGEGTVPPASSLRESASPRPSAGGTGSRGDSGSGLGARDSRLSVPPASSPNGSSASPRPSAGGTGLRSWAKRPASGSGSGSGSGSCRQPAAASGTGRGARIGRSTCWIRACTPRPAAA